MITFLTSVGGPCFFTTLTIARALPRILQAFYSQYTQPTVQNRSFAFELLLAKFGCTHKDGGCGRLVLVQRKKEQRH